MSVLAAFAAIAVLMVLIFVHELGHFLAARSQGIHVNRFSLGFGPIIWKYQGSKTEYAIRAFPLGGFVGFPDDDPDCDIPRNDPDLLSNRPILDRAIVISAGVIANLIFAYFLLTTQAGLVGVPQVTEKNPGILIQQLVPNAGSAATEAGIKAGDVVLAANGREFLTYQDEVKVFQEIIQKNAGSAVKLDISRGEEKLNLTVVPKANSEGNGSIGVNLSPNQKIERRKVTNPIQAVKVGASEFQRILTLTFSGLGQLVTNFGETAPQLSGPVNIVKAGANIAQNDSGSLLFFGALISINLAVINILPLPALDGGQLAFLLFEGVMGKPLPARIQEGVMQTGLMLLLGLGMFLIVKETTELQWVQQLFQ
ncbi:MAG: RIP metalloprotease RseP [Cyanobacteria bacterium P01_A01_bin.84]